MWLKLKKNGPKPVAKRKIVKVLIIGDAIVKVAKINQLIRNMTGRIWV